jgi:hypothetical protein
MSDEAKPAEGTALAIVDNRSALVAVIASEDGLERLVERIEIDARARAAELDISTKKGREAIASLTRTVLGGAKAQIEAAAMQLTEEWRNQTSAVVASRKGAVARIEALQAQLRKELTEYENADKIRIAEHEAAIIEIANLANTEGMTAAEIQTRIEAMQTPAPRQWQEFATKAAKTLATAEAQVRAAHKVAVEREAAEAEEAKRVAAEAAAAAEKAEADRIAREAEIAAQAKREAEEAAALLAKQAAEAAEAAIAKANAEAAKAQEEAEAARVRGHQDALDAMRDATVVVMGQSSTAIKSILENFMNRPERNWEEFQTEAAKLRESCITFLQRKRDETIQAEQEAAEAALKAEQDKRDAEVAAAAAEARRKLMDVIKWIKEAPWRVNREWEIDHQISHIESTSARIVELMNEHDWLDMGEVAALARRNTSVELTKMHGQLLKRKEEIATEAAAKIRRDQEAATAAALKLDEDKRAAQKLKDDIAAKKKADNIAHRRLLNRDVIADLITVIMSESGTTSESGPDKTQQALAEEIMKALAKGQIRHTTINY